MTEPLPFVSCLCPTYGRCPSYQHLLEESIESFLLQDYPADRRELIVLNDHPDQQLLLKWDRAQPWPNVRIARSLRRFDSLGEKYNQLCKLANGELLMPWEDDDISLPKRISQAVAKLKAQEAAYWKPPQVLFLQDGQAIRWQHGVGVRHHAGIFTKEAWQRVGGYPKISGAQDAVFDQLLQANCNYQEETPAYQPGSMPPGEWQYIYRFGVSPVHLSGVSDHEEFYRRVGTMPVPGGIFDLTPHWRRDYAALAAEATAGVGFWDRALPAAEVAQLAAVGQA